jgi:hypothetical protein
MKFLIELDHPKTGQSLTAEAARAFIEGVILQTLATAEQLVAEDRILAGGPVAGATHFASLRMPSQPNSMIRPSPASLVSRRRYTSHAAD